MSIVASSHPKTRVGNAPNAFLKPHSRVREALLHDCIGVSVTKSLSCIEIPLGIYDGRVGLELFSQDPIGLAPDVNMYRYVGNDPQNWIDPSGLVGWDEGGPAQSTEITKAQAEELRSDLRWYLNPFSRGGSNLYGKGYSSKLLRHYLDRSGKPVEFGCEAIRGDKAVEEFARLALVTYYIGNQKGKSSLQGDGKVRIWPYRFMGGDLGTAIGGTHGITAAIESGNYEQHGFHGVFDGKISFDVYDVYDFHKGGLNIQLPGFSNFNDLPGGDFVKDSHLCDLETYNLARRFDVNIRYKARVRAIFSNDGLTLMSLEILGLE
jgi:hypothetical protein